MRSIIKTIICFLIPFIISLAACHHDVIPPGGEEVLPGREGKDLRCILEPLIQENVIPKLEEALFIRQPTFIMAGRIGETCGGVGQIDDVTREIRKLITIELAGKPGYSLVQRHSLETIKNRVGRVTRQEMQADCRQFTEPKYYLVIDAYASGRTVYVDMIALEAGGNVATGSMAFRASFNFKADEQVIRKLEHKDWDEYLQGTKYYPIENDPDAIAAYLAYDLMCILGSVNIDWSRDSFYIDVSKLGQYERDICADHLKNYLVKFGFPMVGEGGKATHKIVLSVATANSDFILWATVFDRDGRSLGGAASRVYYKCKDSEKCGELPLTIREIQERYDLDKLKGSDLNKIVRELRLAVKDVTGGAFGDNCRINPLTITVSSTQDCEGLRVELSGAQSKKMSKICDHDGMVSFDGLAIGDFPLEVEVPLLHYKTTIPNPLDKLDPSNMLSLLQNCPCGEISDILISRLRGTYGSADIRIIEPREGEGETVGPLIAELVFKSGRVPKCVKVVARGRNKYFRSRRTDGKGRVSFDNIPIHSFPLIITAPDFDCEVTANLPNVAVDILIDNAYRLLQSNPDQAIQMLNTVIDAQQSVYLPEMIFFYRGFAYYYQDSLEEAIRDFTHAVQINQCFVTAFIQRAKCYMKQGSQKSFLLAKNDFDTAIDISELYQKSGWEGIRWRCPSCYSNALSDLIPDQKALDMVRHTRAFISFEFGDQARACKEWQELCERGFEEACQESNGRCSGN